MPSDRMLMDYVQRLIRQGRPSVFATGPPSPDRYVGGPDRIFYPFTNFALRLET
jgi:hypothetical protein